MSEQSAERGVDPHLHMQDRQQTGTTAKHHARHAVRCVCVGEGRGGHCSWDRIANMTAAGRRHRTIPALDQPAHPKTTCGACSRVKTAAEEHSSPANADTLWIRHANRRSSLSPGPSPSGEHTHTHRHTHTDTHTDTANMGSIDALQPCSYIRACKSQVATSHLLNSPGTPRRNKSSSSKGRTDPPPPTTLTNVWGAGW